MSASTESDKDFEDYQRHLALVDENIGLRAALAQESVRNSPSRQRIEEVEHEIRELRRSMTWRVGRFVLSPIRIVRGLLRRPRS
jgi:hypothetical protein